MDIAKDTGRGRKDKRERVREGKIHRALKR
jgi:hypothetical protein